jgi:hypothetical protein
MLNTVILNSLPYAQHCHFEFALTIILNSLSYAQHCHFDYYILDYCTSHFLLLHLSSYCLQFFGLWKFLSYYSTTTTPTLLPLSTTLLHYCSYSLLLLYTTTTARCCPSLLPTLFLYSPLPTEGRRASLRYSIRGIDPLYSSTTPPLYSSTILYSILMAEGLSPLGSIFETILLLLLLL